MPGKITIDVYYASTLLNEADMYDGILSGTADIGIVSISRNVSRFPLTQLFCYPGFAFNGSGVAAEAHWNWIQSEKPAEYDDIVVLMTQATGPMALVTKDKVAKVEDVAGKQYRADGVVGETVSAWGGVPVTIEDSETYESLRSGLLQGSYSFYGGSAKNKLDEVAEYVMISPLTNMAFIFGMNKERFAEMPIDQQEAFMQAAVETMEQYTWWFAEENWVTDSDVVAFAKKMKHVLIGPDDPAFAGFNDKGKVLQAEYVKKLDEQGLDGTGQLEIIRKFVEEANAKVTWDEYLAYYPPLTYAD
jgi:TRAP-type C4-dicarboxylate transport system substrate-binding protein